VQAVVNSCGQSMANSVSYKSFTDDFFTNQTTR
jgi:hypothetical protein